MDENTVFSKTVMSLISKSNIDRDAIEGLAYALLAYKIDKNEDNSFITDCLISGWVSKDDYEMLRSKYHVLFRESTDKAFGSANSISNGTLLADVLDLRDAKNSLKRLRESQRKPDYWDCLSEIKKKDGDSNWFHASH